MAGPCTHSESGEQSGRHSAGWVIETEQDDELRCQKKCIALSPAVKLLDSILLSAMQRRASDIHIEAADRATR